MCALARAGSMSELTGGNMFRFFTNAILTFVAVMVLAAPALAGDIKAALIYDMGGKFDKSFNEAAYNGSKRFM